MGKFPYINLSSKRLEKLSKRDQENLVFDLINAFALVKDPFNSALLLQDLLTAAEIKNLGKRLRIAKLLYKGETHEQIVKRLHCSFGTVAKVSAWLEEAGEGFKRIIEKLPKQRKLYRFKRDVLGYYGLPQIIIGTYLNALKASERERIEKFMQNKDKKKRLYREIQNVIDKEFVEQYHLGKKNRKNRL